MTVVSIDSEVEGTDRERSKAGHLAAYREHIEAQRDAARETQAGRGFRQGKSG